MLKILLYAVPIVLAVYALVDLVQTPDEDVQGLPKLVWVVLIVLAWVVGPVAWLLAGRKGRGVSGMLLPPAGGSPGGRPRRVIAPDDDPDFLRGLGRRRPPDDDDPNRPRTGP